jgi:hypothetical protein
MRTIRLVVSSAVMAGALLWTAGAGAEVGIFGITSADVSPVDGLPVSDARSFEVLTIEPEDLPIFREVSSFAELSPLSMAEGYAAAGLGKLQARSLARFEADGTEGRSVSESLAIAQETATAGGPLGAPVSVNLLLSVTGTASPPASDPNDLYDASATALLIAGDVSSINLLELIDSLVNGTPLPTSPDYSLLSFNSLTSPPGDVTGTFATTGGTTFDLFYGLITHASVTGQSGAAEAAVDYSKSLTFSLFPQQPGVAVTTFGGQTFLNPVPEPETWALLAIGLAGIAFVHRRRAHRLPEHMHG